MSRLDSSHAADTGAGQDPGSARSRDLSAVPTFLRERRPRSADSPAATAAPATTASAPRSNLPRPSTPTAPRAAAPAPTLDPAALPMPSLSRRRVVTAAGILVAGWMLLSFVRQVGEATAATTRADELRRANAELRAEVGHLQADLQRVQDVPYILLAGRGVGLGGRGEIPFSLAPGASPLPDDAPGSAGVRLGAAGSDDSPLDAWLTLLFGPRA